MILLLSLLIGAVTGLRAMMAPAALSWAAHKRGLDLSGSWLAVLGYRFSPWVLGIAAFGELITDQLPSTPSRKLPLPFITRLLVGGLSGGALAVPAHLFAPGIAVGVVGAGLGTLGGASARAWIAKAFANDRPAAILEDLVAIVATVFIIRTAT